MSVFETGVRRRLELFGGPILKEDEEPRRLSPFQGALLALVYAQQGRPLSRAQAIWLLWEEDDSSQGRQRIRQLLYALRRRLGFEAIHAPDEDDLVVDPDLACDFEHYRGHLDAGKVAAATALLRAGFLSGLRKSPCAEFDRWVEGKEQALRRELRRAAGKLWDQAAALSDWSGRREAAEGLYQLDPQDEGVLRQVIESRAMTGSHQEARAAYASFAERLAEDGDEPSPDTRVLVERVEAMDVSQREAESVSRSPFVGRAEVVNSVLAALSPPSHQTPGFVVVRGEPGSGKSRLLEELAKQEHLSGHRTLWLPATATEAHLTLGPMVDALSRPATVREIRLLPEPWQSVLMELVSGGNEGSRAPALGPVLAAVATRRLYDAVLALFHQLAADQPLTIFLDDLQWCDSTTVEALAYLERRCRSSRVRFVASTRPGDEALSRLADAPKAALVDLEPLEPGPSLALVASLLPDSAPEEVARTISELGAGNPLYLIELARGYLEGRVELPTPEGRELFLPFSIAQLFRDRISQLSPHAREILELLAVWVRPVTLPELTQASRLSPESLLSSLEELETRGAIVARDGVISITHDLLRSVLTQDLGTFRKTALHRDIITCLLEDRSTAAVEEIAIHANASGDRDRAAEYALRAGRAAAARGASTEAADLLQVALANTHEPREQAMLTKELGSLFYDAFALDHAAPVLELATERLRAIGFEADALETEVLRCEAMGGLDTLPDSTLAARLEEVARRAEQLGRWDIVAMTLDALAHLHYRTEDLNAMRGVLRKAEDCFARGGPEARSIAGGILALGVLYGDGQRALDAARDSVLAASNAGRPDLLFRAQNRLILPLLYRGMLATEEGLEVATQARLASEQSGDRVQRYYLEVNLGVFHMDSGDSEAALEAFERAARLLGERDETVYQVHVPFNRGELAILLGDYGGARRWLQRAEEARLGRLPPYLHQLIRAGQGICALETGRLSEARELSEDVPTSVTDWHFDASLLVDFHARLLARLEGRDAALAYVEGTALGIEGRLTQAWLKVRTIEGMLARRLHVDDLERRLAYPLEVAESLQLRTRAATLRSLMLAG